MFLDCKKLREENWVTDHTFTPQPQSWKPTAASSRQLWTSPVWTKWFQPAPPSTNTSPKAQQKKSAVVAATLPWRSWGSQALWHSPSACKNWPPLTGQTQMTPHGVPKRPSPPSFMKALSYHFGKMRHGKAFWRCSSLKKLMWRTGVRSQSEFSSKEKVTREPLQISPAHQVWKSWFLLEYVLNLGVTRLLKLA